MSYSRWGSRGSGHWYTYWRVQDKETENRDTAFFDICTVATFTAKQLRDDMDGCMAEVRKRDDTGDLDELRQYATEFLADVDREYPSNELAHGIPNLMGSKKRNCNHCRAATDNGCGLGFSVRRKEFAIGVTMGFIPLEPCPKPTTYKAWEKAKNETK